MKLTILGSSSSGNCYILHNDTEALIIELGVSFTDVKVALKGKISKVTAAIVTHGHKDHSKYINACLDSAIPVYMSEGTYKTSDIKINKEPNIIKALEQFKVGNFTILPFDTQHDCDEPLGFLIEHEQCGKVLFATDTYYLKYKFSGLNNILIEANYDIDILNEMTSIGEVHQVVRKRTVQSHMSIETTISTLLANDLSAINNVILIHLSSKQSNPIDFANRVQQAIGRPVLIARKGIEINFNKEL